MLSFAIGHETELQELIYKTSHPTNAEKQRHRGLVDKYDSVASEIGDIMSKEGWTELKVICSSLGYFGGLTRLHCYSENVLFHSFLIQDHFQNFLESDITRHLDFYVMKNIREVLKNVGGKLSSPPRTRTALLAGQLKANKYYTITDESDLCYATALLDSRLKLDLLVEHLGDTRAIQGIVHAIRKFLIDLDCQLGHQSLVVQAVADPDDGDDEISHEEGTQQTPCFLEIYSFNIAQ